MIWHRLDDYCIKSDRRYSVAKMISMDKVIYQAWDPKKQCIGMFSTSEEAKDACEKHAAKPKEAA